MSGHIPWEGISRMTDPHQREVQMGYVDGYCLALEHVLGELKRLQDIQMEHVAREDPRWARIVPTMYRPLRKFVNQRLAGSRQTLKALREGIHERQQGVPAEAGLGEGLRGDLGGLPGQPPLQDTAPE